MTNLDLRFFGSDSTVHKVRHEIRAPTTCKLFVHALWEDEANCRQVACISGQ